ncbi:hypothetical protein [Luteimonas sp. gir]
MKMALPALAVTVVPAGMVDPMVAAPILVAIVAIELLIYSQEVY